LKAEGGLMSDNETICAIATALNDSGISIIRISGRNALEAADRIFHKKNGIHFIKDVAANSIVHGIITDKNGIIIDDVMVSVMKEPKSYTREDVVEINCHGGIQVTREVLGLLLETGLVRLADPGEFTKRAFLNGRIDLSAAESVMSLISAKSELAAKNSIKLVEGALYKKVKELKDMIINDNARIEAYLDDPENLDLDGFADSFNSDISTEIREIDHLIKTFDNGRFINDGIKTVILGKPNVGKSSIMNSLLKTERAIVTDIAGTTRDVIEDDVKLGNVFLKLVDTAGIHKTDDIIEKLGIKKAEELASEADLILIVLDSSKRLDREDEEIFKIADGKLSIILMNKSDLSEAGRTDLKADIKKFSDSKIIECSALNNEGFDELENYVNKEFFNGRLKSDDELYITNLRHKECLEKALLHLNNVCESINNKMPEDFYTIDLCGAYNALAELTGEACNDDLINRIFEKFCLGK
jgi:tRNA modification GTPase